MGLEDREWYRKEWREKNRSAYKGSSAPQDSQPIDWTAHLSTKRQKPRTSVWRQFALFFALCFAVYGVFSLIRDLTFRLQTKPPPVSAPVEKPVRLQKV
jgi:hypothetical protein